VFNKIAKKKLISVFILIGAVLIAGGVLFFSKSDIFAQSAPTQWTEKTGEGIMAPACTSSFGPTVAGCSGGLATITFNWVEYPYYYWDPNSVKIYLNGVVVASHLPLTGSYTVGGLSSNVSYNYYLSQLVWVSVGGGFGWVEHSLLDWPTTRSITTPNCALPPTASISANPTSIPYNTASTISWSSTDADSCTVSPPGWTGTSGSQSTGNLTSSQTYTVSCSGPGGSAQSSATVTVLQPPGSFSLSLGGGGAAACNSVPLSWTTSSGADGYRILRGSPRVDISPYQPYTALNFTDYSVSQNTSYIYQIEAYNAGGTTRSNTLNVTTPYCPPTLSFSADPTSIYQGQSATLSWSTSYVTSCTASGAWSGSKSISGSEVVIPSPPPSVTYNLQCFGPGGSVQQSAIINIAPLALPEWKEIIPR
jgi:hypothetical protein